MWYFHNTEFKNGASVSVFIQIHTLLLGKFNVLNFSYSVLFFSHLAVPNCFHRSSVLLHTVTLYLARQIILLRTASITRPQQPYSLSIYAAPSLLGLRVWIPPEAWQVDGCECWCCTGRGLCEGSIPHPGKSYRVYVIMSLIKCQNHPLYLWWVRK
jgi:hypothetical protein